MELIFADDSGKDAKRAKYLVEAAVAFNEDHLPTLEAWIKTFKSQLGIPASCELHWAGRTYYSRSRERKKVITAEEHERLRKGFLKFLATADATVIIAGVEHTPKGDLGSKVATCLEFIAERSQMHLQDIGRARGRKPLGLLIADEPGSKDERRVVTERLRRLHHGGTEWIKEFDTLVMNSVLYPSHLVPGIQLADFVAGAADAFLNGGHVEWWARLQPHVRHKPGDETRILGYGLKLWPETRPLRVGEVEIR